MEGTDRVNCCLFPFLLSLFPSLSFGVVFFFFSCSILLLFEIIVSAWSFFMVHFCQQMLFLKLIRARILLESYSIAVEWTLLSFTRNDNDFPFEFAAGKKLLLGTCAGCAMGVLEHHSCTRGTWLLYCGGLQLRRGAGLGNLTQAVWSSLVEHRSMQRKWQVLLAVVA